MEMVKIDIQRGNKRESYYVNPHQITAIWAEVIDNESPWAGLWMRIVGMPEQLLIGSWEASEMDGAGYELLADAVRYRVEQELDLLRARIQSAASR